MTNSKLSGSANDGTRALNAGVLSEPPSTLSESAGASGLLPWTAEEIESAKKIWHRFANQNALYWEEEREQEIYLLCASDILNTRATPVQAEPLAWRWRNKFTAKIIGDDAWNYSGAVLTPNDILEVEPLYASPPTPVLGEATRLHYARAVGGDPDEMRDNLWKSGLADRGDAILVWVSEGDFWLLSPIEHRLPNPVSAGLDDMGKQNGSEKL